MIYKTKNKKQYATGGTVPNGVGLDEITKMMGMFGPVGSAIGTGMNVLNSLTQPTPMPQATAYKNTNAFGYAEGGVIDELPRSQGMTHEQLMNIVRTIVSSQGQQQGGQGMVNQPSEFNREFSTQDQQPQPVQEKVKTAPTQNAISKLQEKLLSLGYTGIGKKGEVMGIDGILGGRTRAALKKALDNGQVSSAYKKYLGVDKPKPDPKNVPEYDKREQNYVDLQEKFKGMWTPTKQEELSMVMGSYKQPTIPDYKEPDTTTSKEMSAKFKSMWDNAINPDDILKRISKQHLAANDRMLARKHSKLSKDKEESNNRFSSSITGASPSKFKGDYFEEDKPSYLPPKSEAEKQREKGYEYRGELYEGPLTETQKHNIDIMLKRRGYATGGDLSALGNGAYQVQGNNPNVEDGVGVNIGGAQINLDHNEVLDKNKVISDKYFNPLTGNKIVDEYAKIVKGQKDASERGSKHLDPIARRTNELMENQKNDLFKLQEVIASMKGERNQDGSTVQQGQQAYATGGPFDPKPGLQMLQGNMQFPFTTPPDLTQGPDNYSRSPYGELERLPQKQSSNMAYNNVTAVEKLPTTQPYNTDTVGDVHNYSIGLRAQGIGPGSQFNNRPGLGQVSDMVKGMSLQPNGSTQHSGFWDQFTTGDKIGMGVTALSMIPKAISAFKPVQNEPYRTVNAPITMQQLDPTNALYNSANEYRSQMYNTNNNTSTINNSNALRANAYASKLNADNQIMSQYENTNKGLQTDYQNRLGQRQAINNQSMMQTDDLNSRNQAMARTRQMGVYNDIAGGGQTLGNSLNQREHDKIALASMQKMAPDVFGGYMDQLPLLKYLKEQMMGNATKGK